jgi:hypothetical protein
LINIAESDDLKDPITVFTFKDFPETGYVTAVTYGLSLVNHSEWKLAKPELLLTVKSSDLEWGSALGSFVSLFAKDCIFQYGNFGTVDSPLTKDTEMNGFLVFAPTSLRKEDAEVQLNDGKVILSQLYPVYASEKEIYAKIGLEAFWKHPDFDPFDPKRKAITII